MLRCGTRKSKTVRPTFGLLTLSGRNLLLSQVAVLREGADLMQIGLAPDAVKACHKGVVAILPNRPAAPKKLNNDITPSATGTSRTVRATRAAIRRQTTSMFISFSGPTPTEGPTPDSLG